ncbi:MAG: hypothetical protein HY926_09905, partial [Elusimicrobia bacterium]|nr:hypothetical protein [Elusimicrobiota bacterium]
LKGTGAGAPTAVNGTQNQITYWTDANTIGSTAAISVGLGGTGANLAAVATGGLIYKSGATTLGGTAALTGVLKGTGAGAPTAVNGTQNQITYWTDANTIGSTAAISVGLGGTGNDLSAVATGGLIYKSGVTTLAGTGQLSGVLKGNGAGAPSTGATQDDLADGTTYKRYNPASVAIIGGSVSGTVLEAFNKTKAQLNALSISATGEVYFCTDCPTPQIVVSTGTTTGDLASALGGQWQ